LEQQQIELAKACALTYASYGAIQFDVVRRAASKLLRNPLSEIVRMVEKIKRYPDVPGRLKARIQISPDSITGRPFVDMQMFLTMRLLALNLKSAIRNWVKAKKNALLKSQISSFGKRLADKLL
jgi:hypothetical protein